MGNSEVMLPLAASSSLDNLTDDVRRIHCAANNYTCQQHRDIEYLYQNFKYQWQTALSYIAIILSCYFVGMGLLLLHYINQRSITLYDFYLEAYLWCKTPSPDSRGGSSGGGDSSCSRQNSQSQQGGEEGLAGISSSQQVLKETLTPRPILSGARASSSTKDSATSISPTNESPPRLKRGVEPKPTQVVSTAGAASGKTVTFITVATTPGTPPTMAAGAGDNTTAHL